MKTLKNLEVPEFWYTLFTLVHLLQTSPNNMSESWQNLTIGDETYETPLGRLVDAGAARRAARLGDDAVVTAVPGAGGGGGGGGGGMSDRARRRGTPALLP